jgi:hypothetical protein
LHYSLYKKRIESLFNHSAVIIVRKINQDTLLTFRDRK